MPPPTAPAPTGRGWDIWGARRGSGTNSRAPIASLRSPSRRTARRSCGLPGRTAAASCSSGRRPSSANGREAGTASGACGRSRPRRRRGPGPTRPLHDPRSGRLGIPRAGRAPDRRGGGRDRGAPRRHTHRRGVRRPCVGAGPVARVPRPAPPRVGGLRRGTAGDHGSRLHRRDVRRRLRGGNGRRLPRERVWGSDHLGGHALPLPAAFASSTAPGSPSTARRPARRIGVAGP